MRVSKVFCGLLAAAAAGGAAAPASADQTVSLTRVARELGYHYAYLPIENSVSLTRPGTVIVVRPGDTFFSVNARREPVYGMVPVYHNNDIVVSRAFVDEIRSFGPRTPLLSDRAEQAAADAALVKAIHPATGKVDSVAAYYLASESTIVVVGKATPGSRVALVLRAHLSQNLPVVTLDNADIVAGKDGRFRTTLDNAPDRFAYSRFYVEASAAENDTPAIALVVDGHTNKAAQTGADSANLLDR